MSDPSDSSDMKNPDPEGQNQRGKNAFVTTAELRPNDVLFGRGAPIINYPGNKRFRDLVQNRRFEYNAALCHKKKGKIAKEIFSQVLHVQNGRFLRKIRANTPDANRKEGLKETPVEAWILADESSVLEKIKQSLRDKKPGKSTQDHGLNLSEQELFARSQLLSTLTRTGVHEQLNNAFAHHRLSQLHRSNLNPNINYHDNIWHRKLVDQLATMQNQQVAQLRQQQTLQNLLLSQNSAGSWPTTTGNYTESRSLANMQALRAARLLDPLRRSTDLSTMGFWERLASSFVANAIPGLDAAVSGASQGVRYHPTQFLRDTQTLQNSDRTVPALNPTQQELSWSIQPNRHTPDHFGYARYRNQGKELDSRSQNPAGTRRREKHRSDQSGASGAAFESNAHANKKRRSA